MKRWTWTTWLAIPLVVGGFMGPAPEADGAAPTPTRCIASWRGPTPQCPLQQALRVEALGRDEVGARRLALRRIWSALEAVRDAHAAGAPDAMQAMVLGATEHCQAALETETVLTCFPEPQLLDARYCRVNLPVSRCSSSLGYAVEGVAWRDGERAREELCSNVGADLGWLAEDPRALSACEASCWQESLLECGRP